MADTGPRPPCTIDCQGVISACDMPRSLYLAAEATVPLPAATAQAWRQASCLPVSIREAPLEARPAMLCQ